MMMMTIMMMMMMMGKKKEKKKKILNWFSSVTFIMGVIEGERKEEKVDSFFCSPLL